MIRFALVCDNGHEFESWFASNESYDFQIDNSLVACPHCNGVKINKAVMAPAVARKDRAPAAPPKQNVALLGAGDRELRAMAHDLHTKIVAATVDVGADFPRKRAGFTTARRPSARSAARPRPRKPAPCSRKASPSCPCPSCPKIAAETAI